MFNTDVIISEVVPAFIHSPYVTIAVPERKCKFFIKIAMSPKKQRQGIVTETAKAVVNEENVLNVTKAVKSPRLAFETVAAQRTLLQKIRTVC